MNGPISATDPSGLTEYIPAEDHLEATDKLLLPVRAFKSGPIDIQLGVDANMTGHYTAADFNYPDLYKNLDPNVQRDEFVGSVVHAVDREKKSSPGGGAERGWVTAIKFHIAQTTDPTGFVSNVSRVVWGVGTDMDRWYGDDSYEYQTTGDWVDFAGQPIGKAFISKYLNYETSFVAKSSYGVAIVCWKKDKIVGKPLASFYYSDELKVSKSAKDPSKLTCTVVVDYGWTYKGGPTTVDDWSELRNYKTGKEFQAGQ